MSKIKKYWAIVASFLFNYNPPSLLGLVYFSDNWVAHYTPFKYHWWYFGLNRFSAMQLICSGFQPVAGQLKTTLKSPLRRSRNPVFLSLLMLLIALFVTLLAIAFSNTILPAITSDKTSATENSSIITVPEPTPTRIVVVEATKIATIAATPAPVATATTAPVTATTPTAFEKATPTSYSFLKTATPTSYSFLKTATPIRGSTTPTFVQLNWKEYNAVEGKFSIEMPGSVTKQKSAITGVSDSYSYTYFTSEFSFNVTYIDYFPSVIAQTDSKTFLTNARTDYLKVTGGTSSSYKEIKLGDYPGLDYTILTSRDFIRVRSYLVNNWFYRLSVHYKIGTLTNDQVNYFLDSFKLIK